MFIRCLWLFGVVAVQDTMQAQVAVEAAVVLPWES